jgi:WD40 repeat protein/predicted Ser/Thr protein kinase
MSKKEPYSGQRVGNYILKKPLGGGKHGKVYLAWHVNLKEPGWPAAIKLLDYQKLTPEYQQKFFEEAQALARVDNHPHIVGLRDYDVARLRDHGVEHDILFIVMDYIEGENLHDYLRYRAPVELKTAVAYTRQVASALEHVHMKGISHLDVKPENIMRRNKDEVVLIDFGLAQMLAKISGTSQARLRATRGTYLYCAPECIPGYTGSGKPGPASDQYSLAAVTYDLLCGTPPFQGEDIITRRLHFPPPHLRTKNPAIPQEIDNVILKALEKEPQNRYPTIMDFADALSEAYKGQEVTVALVNLAHTYTPEPVRTYSSLRATPARLRVSRRESLGIIGLAAIIGGAVWLAPMIFTTSRQEPGALYSPPVLSSSPPARLGDILLTYRGHSDEVQTAVYSPDGLSILSGGADGRIDVWNASTGVRYRSFEGHHDAITAISVTRAGRYIASASRDPALWIWDIHTGKNVPGLAPFENDEGSIIIAAVFSPDPSNRYLAVARGRTVQVFLNPLYQGWSRPVVSWQHSGLVNALAWSPDGSMLASAGDDALEQVWSITSRRLAFNYTGHQSAVLTTDWSRDGQFIVSADGSGAVHGCYAAPRTPESRRQLFKYSTGQAITSIACAPDNLRIAVGGIDGTVSVGSMGIDSDSDFSYRCHSAAVTHVAWSSDGRAIASSSADQTVRICLATLH